MQNFCTRFARGYFLIIFAFLIFILNFDFCILNLKRQPTNNTRELSKSPFYS
jgi:hypothetical protein